MFTTFEAAKRINVCKSTLLRWLNENLIPNVARDWRGWRIWSQNDIDRARAFKKAYHEKPIPRSGRRTYSRATCAKAAAESMAQYGNKYRERASVSL